MGEKRACKRRGNASQGAAARDYRKYKMTRADLAIGYGIGLLGGTLVIQFKDFLEAFSSSVSAGKNVPDAIRDSWQDMRDAYGEGAFMTVELKRILDSMKNNIRIEASLYDLAERSGLEDIMTFADVFAVITEKGGDIRQVINDTRNLIHEKIETEQRIASSLSSAKKELYLLAVLPVPVLLILDGGILTKDAEVASLVSKSIALVMFVAAIALGRKITNIEA